MLQKKLNENMLDFKPYENRNFHGLVTVLYLAPRMMPDT